MFLGEFQHSLDTKGRVILPAKYRDQLAEGAFVTKGKGGCLSVFTPEEFEQVATPDPRAVEAGTQGAQRGSGLLRRHQRDPARQAGSGRAARRTSGSSPTWSVR